MSLDYRKDVDGLRAIAVVPVVLYHADISFFSGGYVGVDIFFVISGYLISNIILSHINDNNFSILSFYERRIRRIFPALFTLLFFSSCVAFWLMFPEELVDYGLSLRSAALFYSNYYFMFDSGYFALPAETKPLLHIWSLAVEEQFYIIFPLYLYLVSHFFPGKLGLVTIVLLAASLVYSTYLINFSPEETFFSAPARAWELMVGAVLALYPRREPLVERKANALTLMGFGIILGAIFFYTKETSFPGPMAIAPVLGAALIIYVGAANKNIVSRLLSQGIFRFPGLISYSLYLWHWPIFVFYKMYSIEPVSDVEILILILASVLCAFLSWKYIEKPFREKKLQVLPAHTIYAGFGFMLLGVVVGTAYVKNDGYSFRFSKEIRNILSASNDRGDEVKGRCDISEKVCEIGAVEKKHASFAIWGDSHGKSILPSINIMAKNNNVKGIFVGRGGCLPLLGARQIRKGYESCIDNSDAFIRYLSEHPEIKKVVLISRWAIYARGDRFGNEKGHNVYIKDKETESISLDENRKVFVRSFERTIDILSQMDKQIFLVEQIPETEWQVPLDLARAKLLNQNIEFRPKFSDYQERQKFVVEVISRLKDKFSLKIIRPYEEMCSGMYCVVVDEGIPIYRDYNHITKSYALKLSKVFEPLF